MTETKLRQRGSLIDADFSNITSIMQTFLNVIFVTSWIVITLVITLSAVAIVVLLFIA